MPPASCPGSAAAGSSGHRNAAESTSTPQSTLATTTPAPVSASAGLRRTSVAHVPGKAGPAGSSGGNGRLEPGTEDARCLDADDLGTCPDRDDIPRADPAGRYRAEAGDDPHAGDLDPRPGKPDDRLEHPVAVRSRLGPQQLPQCRVHDALGS